MPSYNDPKLFSQENELIQQEETFKESESLNRITNQNKSKVIAIINEIQSTRVGVQFHSQQQADVKMEKFRSYKLDKQILSMIVYWKLEQYFKLMK